MKFDDIRVARILVKTVDILGDNGLEDSQGLQLRQALVRIVGPGLVDYVFHPSDKYTPDLLGVLQEGINVGILHRIDFIPDTTLTPEGGDAAFNGNASTGQCHDIFCAHEVGCCFLDQVNHIA